MSDVMTEIGGRVGLITLNRARALNALTLGMIRDLTGTLLRWRDDPQVLAVAVRGMGRDGPFGVFCAGGDIRFFHRAALSGDDEPAVGQPTSAHQRGRRTAEHSPHPR